MFAHKELSHKVHEPIRSENARHILVWVYRERCEHILYAFWASHAQCLCWFCAAKASLRPPLPILCAHQSKRRACVRLESLRMRDEDLTAICHRTKKKTKPEFQLRRFPWKARLINFKLHVGSSIPIYAFSKAMLLRMCHDTLCDFTQSAKPNNRKQ